MELSLKIPTVSKDLDNYVDPVKEQRKKQSSVKKEREKQVIQDKASIISGKIEPTLR